MKNRKVLVLGITLALLAMVAGTVVAQGTTHGVSWHHTGGGTQITNNNDERVQVSYVWGGFGNQGGDRVNLNAGQSTFVPQQVTGITVLFFTPRVRNW